MLHVETALPGVRSPSSEVAWLLVPSSRNCFDPRPHQAHPDHHSGQVRTKLIRRCHTVSRFLPGRAPSMLGLCGRADEVSIFVWSLDLATLKGPRQTIILLRKLCSRQITFVRGSSPFIPLNCSGQSMSRNTAARSAISVGLPSSVWSRLLRVFSTSAAACTKLTQ